MNQTKFLKFGQNMCLVYKQGGVNYPRVINDQARIMAVFPVLPVLLPLCKCSFGGTYSQTNMQVITLENLGLSRPLGVLSISTSALICTVDIYLTSPISKTLELIIDSRRHHLSLITLQSSVTHQNVLAFT